MLLTSLNFGVFTPKFHPSTTIPEITDILFPMHFWRPDGPSGKNLPANSEYLRDEGSIPGSGKRPWRMPRQPTPVFSPGESQGQMQLVGYRP